MRETKSALIIANYQYKDPDLRQLAAPAQDAESLARVLGDPAICGFEVRTLINELSHNVNREIERFCRNRKLDDMLLLYFSGHGVKDADGQLYFATIDTELAEHNVVRATAVAARFINEVMSGSRSRRQILLLDCCYSGAFKQGMMVRGDKRVGAGEQLEGKGRVVLTASDALQYSFEGETVQGEGVRSVFTNMLVHGLETGEADLDHDGSYSLDEVYDYVHDRVSDEQPDQTPIKMGYVEGKIFIGINPRPQAAELPPELQSSLEDPRHWIRESTVPVLKKMLLGKHTGLSLAAHAALASLQATDRDLEVRRKAEDALAAYADTPGLKREEEAARAKAEAERATRGEVERQRLEREKAEAARLAAEKGETERVAREEAEIKEKVQHILNHPDTRLAEMAEEQRQAREREKAERERQAAEKVAADRALRGKAEKEWQTRERADADRLQKERAELVPQRRRRARYLILGMVGLAVVVGAIWYFWPRPFALQQRHIAERKVTIETGEIAAAAAGVNPKDGLNYVAIQPGTTLAFQEYDPGLKQFQGLKNIGSHTEKNGAGSMNLSGPWYESQTGSYPYVMLNKDSNRNLVLLHPSPNAAAVVAARVESHGIYKITGSFARANDSRSAGHGVRVMVMVNGAAISPPWEKVISSEHDVSPANVFAGSGVQAFDFTLTLESGDSVQFAVFCADSDASYDATALRFVISETNGKSRVALPEDFPI